MRNRTRNSGGGPRPLNNGKDAADESPARARSLLDCYRKDILRCVKCGSCGAVCPSYSRTRDESFSARGRMALIKAALDGRIGGSAVFKDRLATCTSCLACEASCPSGVPVMNIIQAAKELVIAETGPGLISSVLTNVIKRPALFRAATWLAPSALHSFRQSQGSGVEVPERARRQSLKNTGRRGRVALYPGCAVEYFQQDILKSTIRVLTAVGYEVIVPAGLKCCGRPLLSLGDRRSAEELAAHNTALFGALEVDAIVTACASCGLTLKKEYPKLLRSGVKTPDVLDIHEFLSGRIAGNKLNAVNKSVTIHEPCHLGRGQGLSLTVRELIRAIPGITLVEMRGPDRCCGFGGVLRINHRGLSDGIADDKALSIIETRAAVVATGCPGCRMQITDALGRRGSELEVVHTVQLLEQALSFAEPRDLQFPGSSLAPAGGATAKWELKEQTRRRGNEIFYRHCERERDQRGGKSRNC